MTSEEGSVSVQVTTRREIVKTGAKIAYVAPAIAASMQLSNRLASAQAVSGGGPGCGSYFIANAVQSCITVDDDMTIYVNGVPVLQDTSGVTSCNGPTDPFTASPGDPVRITATDSFGICRSFEAIFLFCVDGSASQQLAPAYDGGCDNPADPVPYFDQTVAIAI